MFMQPERISASLSESMMRRRFDVLLLSSTALERLLVTPFLLLSLCGGV